MSTPLIIALGAIAWITISVAAGLFIGRAFKLGDETEAEIHREFARGGDEW